MKAKDWIGEWIVTVALPKSEDPLEVGGEIYEDDRLYIREDGSFSFAYTGGEFSGKWRIHEDLDFYDIEHLPCDRLEKIFKFSEESIRATVIDDEHGITIRYAFERRR